MRISKSSDVMRQDEIFSRNPNVMNGALVFAGTRLPVEILVQHLATGDSLDKFLDDFPSVSREQATAYLELTLHKAEAAYAAMAADEEREGEALAWSDALIADASEEANEAP